MVRVTALLMMLVLMATASAGAQSTNAPALVITRAGSRAIERAPEANFTGDVRVERLYDAVDPSHSSGGFVTFAPGARTAGTRIPVGRSCWSPPAPAVFSSGISRLRRSEPATSSGSQPGSSIGTARRRARR